MDMVLLTLLHTVQLSTGTTQNWATPRQRQRANNSCKDTKSTTNSTVRSVKGYVAAHRSQENQTQTETFSENYA